MSELLVQSIIPNPVRPLITRDSTPQPSTNQETVDTSVNPDNEVAGNNDFVCDGPGCENRSFSCERNLTRHRKTVHAQPTPIYCQVEGCHRHADFPNGKGPFERLDLLRRHMEGFHSTDARASFPRIPANHETVNASANINNQADLRREVKTSFVCSWPGCNRVYVTEWKMRLHHQQKRLPGAELYCWVKGCHRHADVSDERWPFSSVGLWREHMRDVHDYD
ncbi:hypothetical protein H2199_001175 [Coniosporium tulheliwenetii]|uniref:Uncharacterized protein n=1 Tax=Coniosporium tulheliwenetii TaxID=3383036 RepID=A0ACC2ZL80_9PEZI|nr:hypothetical protein H2199_001175 [Cladosporium sp. JES 115]